MTGSSSAYLDILPNADGYNHIAVFSPADSGEPRWLTSGSWEVTGGILGIDPDKNAVYFMAAAPTSIERNLYSASIPKLSAPPAEPAPPVALTESTTVAYYSADFSPKSGFYLLSYEGPNIPYQQVVQIDNKGGCFLPPCIHI